MWVFTVGIKTCARLSLYDSESRKIGSDDKRKPKQETPDENADIPRKVTPRSERPSRPKEDHDNDAYDCQREDATRGV